MLRLVAITGHYRAYCVLIFFHHNYVMVHLSSIHFTTGLSVLILALGVA